MPEIHERNRQLQLRLVYFGPPSSGKAANLQRIHDLLRPDARSRMKAFDTGPERTISFGMTLPASTDKDAWTLAIHVAGCSSPLQKPTKAALLDAADAVAFVADASRDRREENHEAFREAEALLRGARRRKLQGASGEATPIVLQVNKRDRSDALNEDEIESEWGSRPWPIFTAAAKSGDGVRETFTCLLRMAFDDADKISKVGARTGLTSAIVTECALKALRRDDAPGSGA